MAVGSSGDASERATVAARAALCQMGARPGYHAMRHGRSRPARLAADLAARGRRRDPGGARPRLRDAAEARRLARHRGRPRGRGADRGRAARRHAGHPGGRRGGDRGRARAGARPTAFWLVDPLDGTREFAAGATISRSISAWCATAAPVLGVVGVPAHGRAVRRHRRPRRLEARRRPASSAIRARAVPPEGLTVLASRHHAERRAAGGIPAGTQGRGDHQYRLGAEVLPARRGRGGPLSALRPHDGVGHRRAAGGAGGGRRLGAGRCDGRAAALRQAGLGEPAFRLHRASSDRASAPPTGAGIARGRGAAARAARWSPSAPRRSTAWAPTPPTTAPSPRCSRPRAGRISTR